MNRPIRLGVFGAGQVYRQLYAPALALRPEFRVVGSADPVAPARFRRPEDLLAAAEVDGVIVLSPPALHAEHVGLALARGVRVLVEKPPATTIAGVDGWANPELVACAFSRRYWKPYRNPMRGARHFVYELQTNPATWGARAAEPVERDLLPHAADLAGWLSGSAIADIQSVSRGPSSASGTFLLENGGRFEWRVAHGESFSESLTCDGTAVPAAIPGPVGEALRRLRRAPTAAVAGLSALLADWAASFDGPRPATLPGIDAARSCARVIETVERVASSPSP